MKLEVKVEKGKEPAPEKRGPRTQGRPGHRQQQKFEGRCDSLKGFTFDCSDGRQADKYVTTMRKVAEFVGRTYAYGGDIRTTIENEQIYIVPRPKDIKGKGASDMDRRILDKQVDEYVKRDAKLKENCSGVFSLLLGQCTDHMRAKLEALDEYEEMKRDFDLVKLIKSIKGLTYKFDGQKYQPLALHQAKEDSTGSPRVRRPRTHNTLRGSATSPR